VLDGFRVKPDEFNTAVNFYIEDIKLTAFEQADTSYTVQWNYTNAGTATPTLELDMTALEAVSQGRGSFPASIPPAARMPGIPRRCRRNLLYLRARHERDHRHERDLRALADL